MTLLELGRVFHATDGGSTEKSCLAGISFTRDSQLEVEEHFRMIKGAVEEVTLAVGQRQVAFTPALAGDAPWQQANQIAGKARTIWKKYLLHQPGSVLSKPW